jgi:hypothetical protein
MGDKFAKAMAGLSQTAATTGGLFMQMHQNQQQTKQQGLQNQIEFLKLLHGEDQSNTAHKLSVLGSIAGSADPKYAAGVYEKAGFNLSDLFSGNNVPGTGVPGAPPPAPAAPTVPLANTPGMGDLPPTSPPSPQPTPVAAPATAARPKSLTDLFANAPTKAETELKNFKDKLAITTQNQNVINSEKEAAKNRTAMAGNTAILKNLDLLHGLYNQFPAGRLAGTTAKLGAQITGTTANAGTLASMTSAKTVLAGELAKQTFGRVSQIEFLKFLDTVLPPASSSTQEREAIFKTLPQIINNKIESINGSQTPVTGTPAETPAPSPGGKLELLRTMVQNAEAMNPSAAAEDPRIQAAKQYLTQYGSAQ